MRRLMMHMLVGLMVVAMFAVSSCGGNDGPPDEQAGTETDAPASPPASLAEISSEDIIPLYEDSAVFIVAEGFYGGASAGTGIVLDTEGHILTNNHVVERGGQPLRPQPRGWASDPRADCRTQPVR